MLWFLTLRYIIKDDTMRCAHVVYGFGGQREYQVRANTKTSCDWSKNHVAQRARKAKQRVTSVSSTVM